MRYPLKKGAFKSDYSGDSESESYLGSDSDSDSTFMPKKPNSVKRISPRRKQKLKDEKTGNGNNPETIDVDSYSDRFFDATPIVRKLLNYSGSNGSTFDTAGITPKEKQNLKDEFEKKQFDGDDLSEVIPYDDDTKKFIKEIFDTQTSAIKDDRDIVKNSSAFINPKTQKRSLPYSGKRLSGTFINSKTLEQNAKFTGKRGEVTPEPISDTEQDDVPFLHASHTVADRFTKGVTGLKGTGLNSTVRNSAGANKLVDSLVENFASKLKEKKLKETVLFREDGYEYSKLSVISKTNDGEFISNSVKYRRRGFNKSLHKPEMHPDEELAVIKKRKLAFFAEEFGDIPAQNQYQKDDNPFFLKEEGEQYSQLPFKTAPYANPSDNPLSNDENNFPVQTKDSLFNQSEARPPTDFFLEADLDSASFKSGENAFSLYEF